MKQRSIAQIRNLVKKTLGTKHKAKLFLHMPGSISIRITGEQGEPVMRIFGATKQKALGMAYQVFSAMKEAMPVKVKR